MVPELDLVAKDLAKVLSVVIRVMKGRFLAIFELVQLLGTFKQLHIENIKAELMNMDHDAHLEIKQSFDSALSIDDPELLKKITDTVDVLDQMLDLLAEGVSLVQKAQELVLKVRQLVGV